MHRHTSTLTSQKITGSERKRVEEALRQSEARLRIILDNSPAAIYMKVTESRLVLVNRETAEIMGITPEEAVGKTDFEIYADRTIAEQIFAMTAK